MKEQRKIKKQIDDVKQKLDNFPTGKLVYCMNGRGYKWYVSDGHTKTYISKANRELARELAWKKYWNCLLEDLEQEKKALDAYIKCKSGSKKHVEELLEKDHGCMKLLEGTLLTKSQELMHWQRADYEKNPHNPEHLIHNTIAGHKVRSKSEAMIVMFLYNNQIPYRYECALTLDGTTIYPDFTIRHPKTGQIYYWEHFGKMDDENYIKKTQRKYQIYTSNGIIPTIHLITTYETKDNPLDMGTILETIERYFI